MPTPRSEESKEAYREKPGVTQNLNSEPPLVTDLPWGRAVPAQGALTVHLHMSVGLSGRFKIKAMKG